MNDICKVWSSPWRAMQHDLAAGLGRAAEPLGAVNAVRLHAGAVAACSWLGRVHVRRAAASQIRR